MIRTNTDCTIYNRYENASTGKVEFRRKYVPAVFWEPRKGASITERGTAAADALTVYIPYDASGYVGARTYAGKAAAVVGMMWTLAAGEDYIVKGDVLRSKQVLTEDEMKSLKKKNRECYKITTVDDKMFGSWRMWHWEVGAK